MSEAEREYARNLARIREAEGTGDLDEIGRDPEYGRALKTFGFCAFVTALGLLVYFALVASH